MEKRIQTNFKSYLDKKENIEIKIIDGEQAVEYFKDKKDINKGQFKYFINIDIYLYPPKNVKFFIIEKENVPISISHIRKSTDWYRIWKLSFLSVKIGEENKGYASKLADYMFKYYSKNNLIFETSPYSNEGYLKLKPLFNKLSKKYKVPFVDNGTLYGTDDPGYN